MQSVENTYRLLWDERSTEGTRTELQVLINGVVYGQDKIVSLKTHGSLFAEGSPATVGNCLAREIDLVLRDYGDIPRMATIQVQVSLYAGWLSSNWMDKGTFFVDSRAHDRSSGELILHGYDAMLKTEQQYTVEGEQGNWSMTDLAVCNEICSRIGIALDSRTKARMTRKYAVGYPNYGRSAYTMREVLGYIGAMYAGNWTISDQNKLLLIPLGVVPQETNRLVNENGDFITFGGVRIIA